MSPYKYTLEPYKGINSRYRCPSCNKARTFTRYIDTETGRHLAEHVGKCDREINCGYHFTPKQYFGEIGSPGRDFVPHRFSKPAAVQSPACSQIPDEIFKQSLHIAGYDANHFALYLLELFGAIVVGQLIERYFIGTSAHWHGATVFWQVDIKGAIRTGKIMLYDMATGKRVKHPYSHITWVHTELHPEGYQLQQCFFGEHLLLLEPGKPVAIVESEKTAVIASACLPEYTWLATGSLASLTADKAQVLKGRTVALFPDLGCFDKWSRKAKELSSLCRITVSSLLEENTTAVEKAQGLDLADYFTRVHTGRGS